MDKAAPLESDAGHPLSFPGHLRATLVFGLPLAGAQLAGIAVGVTDTVMIGWLGATELAAGVLAHQVSFVLWIFGVGLAFAVVPIAANARGKGDTRGVRRSVRMGLWVVTLYGVLTIAPMWYAKDILLALGQEQVTAELAQGYTRVAILAMWPILLVMALRSFLTAIELAQVVLWATAGGALLNIPLNYAFIFGNFGAPRLELVGAAVASAGTNTLTALIMIVYVLRKKEAREYTIFSRIWRPDWDAFFEILRLGWPISAGILSEVSLFIGASIMMGWIGTIPLAAHGIALQIASVTFMVPLGLSNAATVRVGTALGRGDHYGLGQAGYAALLIAACFSFAAALVFFVFPEPLIRLFLDFDNANSAAVLAYAVPLLFIAAIFQLVDGLQVVGVGNLRGLKDTKVPMVIGIISFWMIGIPVGYVLAFPLGLEGFGLWIGLAVGLLTAAILLNWRFFARERLGLLNAA